MHDDNDKLEERSSETQDGEDSNPVAPSAGDHEPRREDLLDAEGQARHAGSSSMERHREVNPESYGPDSEVIDPDFPQHGSPIGGPYLVERSAPLPTVDEFGGYEQVLPGAADRILRMAEESMAASHENIRADVEVQKSIAYSVRSAAKISERQQWIFAAIAIIALIGSFILGWHGKDIPSVVGVIVAAGSGWMSFQAFQKGQKITPKTGEDES